MRLTLEKTKKIFFPDDDDQGYVNIRALSTEARARIQSESSETVMDKNGDVSISHNNYRLVNGIADACIVGWGNVFDSRGEELKYNSVSMEKVSHMTFRVNGKSVRFKEWIAEEHAAFIAEIEGESRQAEEN